MDWNPLLADISTELKLKERAISAEIRTEEQFERQFVEGIVRDCVATHSPRGHLRIATHPWVKPETPKPYADELLAQIKCWKECKEWANVIAWVMKHTLDMFVWDQTTEDHECIAIEVKLCKASNGKMPTGEFQRMIGQSALFLGPQNHKAVVAVFGFKGDASGELDDHGMTDSLRSLGIWPVVLCVPNLS
jgi:hypothetical protein